MSSLPMAGAIQRALDAAGALDVPFTPAGHRIDGTLHPRSDQARFLDGTFVAGSDAVMWDFAGVLETSVVGSPWINDPRRRTGIRVTNAPVCNVHDNDVVSATIAGVPGSQDGQRPRRPPHDLRP